MFYTTNKPVERKSIISAYSVPAIRKIEVFGNNINDTLRVRKAFISLDCKNQRIRISKAAVTFMQLQKGQRFTFFMLEDSIYCCVAADGNILSIASRGDMCVRNSLLIYYLNKKMGAHGSFKCDIKRTKSEFNANTVYELELPYRYKRSYFVNKFKN